MIVTPFPWSDMVIIGALIVLNGAFAMSELAIVSSSPRALQAAAEEGRWGARAALALSADSGKFLSTVQIGITLIGIVAGAYSGASLGAPLGQRLEALGVPERYSLEAGFFAVIALTTYLSVVVGELVPKQIALRSAVPIACVLAPPMAVIARVAAPIVWLLDRSSYLLITLLGVRSSAEDGLTTKELYNIFLEARRSGIIEDEQTQILAGVVRLAERSVRDVMTPRTDLDWIDVNADEDQIRKTIAETPHSLLPVGDGSNDRILGVVKVREVLAKLLAGKRISLRRLMKKAQIVPDQLDALDALRALQQSEVAMAMVHDEYGHLDGVVTPVDLLTALVGQFESDRDVGEVPFVIDREDGSMLIAGNMPADQLSELLGIEHEEDREFTTAAGFALWVLKKLPREGEEFNYQDWRFEVVDMDGRRIDKLLAVRNVIGSDTPE